MLSVPLPYSFFSCKDLLDKLRDALRLHGVKVKETRELLGVAFTLFNWSDKDTIVSNLPFCRAELKERLDPYTRHNPGLAWELDAERLKPFLKSNGKFHYTYSERMGHIPNIIKELGEKKNSRRAFLAIWSEGLDAHERDWAEGEWIPCSIGYQFLLRSGKLHMVYFMRSCNIDWLPTDLWLAIGLLEYVAKEVEASPGELNVMIGSLHAFNKK